MDKLDLHGLYADMLEGTRWRIETRFVVPVPGFTSEQRHEFFDAKSAVGFARGNCGSGIEIQQRLEGWE